VIDEYGSDAVRYWAAGGRPGMDVAFDRNQLKVGRRLGIKLLNASKFVLSFGEPTATAAPSQPLDLAVLDKLAAVVADATTAFESYDYTRALERTESFFWSFCDDYVELVKSRAYAGDESALATLRTALSVLLRLLAPILPFVTEDVWSWWQDGSIHRAAWPARTELPSGSADGAVFDIAGSVLAEIRKAKTAAKKSLRADVRRAVVSGSTEQLAALDAARADVIDAGRIAELVSKAGGELTVDVLLAD
jgi:valyl-tRNA synthetase